MCRVIVNKKTNWQVVTMDGYLIILLLTSITFLSNLLSLNYRMRPFLDALAKL